MKLKMVVVDLELTLKQKRVSAVALACFALVAGTSIAFAEVPVTFVANEVLYAADLNENFTDLDARLVGAQGDVTDLQLDQALRLAGVDAETSGVNPDPVNPATTQMIWQAGSSVVATDASGRATVSFPAEFPNDVLTVITTVGDDTCGGTGTKAPYTTGSFVVTTSPNASSCRVNWIAIGW